jgi:hypothetical protein
MTEQNSNKIPGLVSTTCSGKIQLANKTSDNIGQQQIINNIIDSFLSDQIECIHNNNVGARLPIIKPYTAVNIPTGINFATDSSLNSERTLSQNQGPSVPLFTQNITSSNVHCYLYSNTNPVNHYTSVCSSSVAGINPLLTGTTSATTRTNTMSSPDPSGTHGRTKETSDQSVVNLSNITLSPAMSSLLSKGLNFCPTPGEHSMHDLKADMDKFHVSLRRKQFFSKSVDPNLTLDQDTMFILDPQASTPPDIPFDNSKFRNPSPWCPKGPIQLESMIIFNENHLNEYTPIAPGHHNLTAEEKLALAELKSNPNIVIKPADKGSAVVIQNRMDYIQEGLRQLSDQNFYRQVDTDLTSKHNQEVSDLLKKLVNNKEISDKCAKYLFIEKPRTPQLYLLPKIHKKKSPVPGRPIVSGNSSPTERISQLADHFLQPLVQQTASYVRDTTDFLCKLEDVTDLLPGALLCTIDVTSLYTNIPNDEGISACKKILNKHRTFSNTPSNETIASLLEYVLTKNNFDFDSKHYLQIGGTAMGTKVAPSFANIFMADFEDKYVYNYPTKPSLWLRYIDDIFLIWEHSNEELEAFLGHLNSCHHSIKFTSESSPSHVNFLDTTIHTSPDGTLFTDLYCKPTDSHNYLMYESAHPSHCKTSLPYSQFLRIRRICSKLQDFDKNALMLSNHFLRRGYPITLIESALIKARRKTREDLLHPETPPSQTQAEDNLYAISTYHPGAQPLKNIIQNNWPVLGRTHTTANVFNSQIIFGHRRNKNLRDLLVSAKLPEANPKKKLTSADPISPINKCKAKMACNYCPKLDHSGTITSFTNKRTYFSKKHISCRSHNLIYCISCTKCSMQYVGQTSNFIGERFKCHFQNIKTALEIKSGSKKPSKTYKEEPIGRHFSSIGHTGTNNIIIHVLDFIDAPSRSPPAQKLRDNLERKWMHRLQTLAPFGLNLAD